MHTMLTNRPSRTRRVAVLARLLLGATLGLATGCGGDSATGPKANPNAGVYALKQIDGAGLPVEVYHGPYFDSAKPHFYNQMVVKAIKGAFDLKPDGTYTLGTAGSISSASDASSVSGGSSGEERGRYRFDGTALHLEPEGAAPRVISTFAYDDGTEGEQPRRLYFGGAMLKRIE